jgi:hypothetical protein
MLPQFAALSLKESRTDDDPAAKSVAKRSHERHGMLIDLSAAAR